VKARQGLGLTVGLRPCRLELPGCLLKRLQHVGLHVRRAFPRALRHAVKIVCLRDQLDKDLRLCKAGIGSDETIDSLGGLQVVIDGCEPSVTTWKVDTASIAPA